MQTTFTIKFIGKPKSVIAALQFHCERVKRASCLEHYGREERILECLFHPPVVFSLAITAVVVPQVASSVSLTSHRHFVSDYFSDPHPPPPSSFTCFVTYFLPSSNNTRRQSTLCVSITDPCFVFCGVTRHEKPTIPNTSLTPRNPRTHDRDTCARDVHHPVTRRLALTNAHPRRLFYTQRRGW